MDRKRQHLIALVAATRPDLTIVDEADVIEAALTTRELLPEIKPADVPAQRFVRSRGKGKTRRPWDR